LTNAVVTTSGMSDPVCGPLPGTTPSSVTTPFRITRPCLRWYGSSAGVCGRSGDVRALGFWFTRNADSPLPSLLYAVPLRVKVNFLQRPLRPRRVRGRRLSRQHELCSLTTSRHRWACFAQVTEDVVEQLRLPLALSPFLNQENVKIKSSASSRKGWSGRFVTG
jgi:hypothetical protein